MRKFLYSILFVIAGSGIKAQTTFEGSVKNKDNDFIPYCSIGIKNTKIGTITNEKGAYKFLIPDSLKDKEIVFSSVGYFDKIVSANELKRNSHIILDDKATALQEVVISAKKLKEKIIGQKSRPFLTFSKMFDKNVPTIEQGNIFEIYQKTRLESYNFYIIPSSKYAQITLKLNIYSLKNDRPDKSLLKENIIYKTSSIGWQNINLSNYKLLFNGLDQIAITLQLVEYKPLADTEFVFGVSAKKTLSKNLLFRYQSQGNWEAYEGSFISNINISYSKDPGEKEIVEAKEAEAQNDPNTKTFVEVYKNREKAQKTMYGKNKEGKYMELQDAKIYYETYGKGEPLILLHGNNGSIADFYQQIPFFSKYYRVIAIDTRGQGRSTDLSTNEYSYQQFAADLFKLTQHLKLDKINILGWSDGGNTGLIFNAEHPELVNKLITIGANLNPNGVEEDLINTFKQQLSANTTGTNQRLIRLMLNQPNITTEQLNHINNPVLVMAGNNDVIKEAHTKSIQAAIRNATLQIIPNASHYVPFEQPEKLNELVLKFLGK
ncbi:alpha/beta fold hydrolase [Pedobacter sp. Hv1]|uniref:alpha/beta fold hydrolase n=1 Tax=Pedobacter sp. Hv1 TaxID=1740090 RepID=UPI0006D89487|nr:alpha/beta fold hydrolase [Pedobacter sp. Hv1]KQB98821.1 oxidoreductase [Pedobacter sp. Hv1]